VPLTSLAVINRKLLVLKIIKHKHPAHHCKEIANHVRAMALNALNALSFIRYFYAHLLFSYTKLVLLYTCIHVFNITIILWLCEVLKFNVKTDFKQPFCSPRIKRKIKFNIYIALPRLASC